MQVTPRAGWGAAPARGSTPLNPARVTLIVLHHTTGSYRGPSSVRGIQAFHQGPERGWSDIGYNFLVAPTGEIFEGRGWGMVGAHAKGRNSESIGIAYIGDGGRSVPEAAKRSILLLAREADSRFGVLRRVGHRDVGSTVCPGDVLYAWWSAGPSLPAARPSTPMTAPEVPSGVVTPEEGEVAAQRISERRGPIPDLRDGWLRHMARSGWLRRR